jgi:hypothetical protein
LEEHIEEPVAEPEPDPEPEPEQEPVSEIQEEKSEPVLEETAPEDAQKSSSPAPTDIAQTVQEDLRVWNMSSFLLSVVYLLQCWGLIPRPCTC